MNFQAYNGAMTVTALFLLFYDQLNMTAISAKVTTNRQCVRADYGPLWIIPLYLIVFYLSHLEIMREKRVD